MCQCWVSSYKRLVHTEVKALFASILYSHPRHSIASPVFTMSVDKTAQAPSLFVSHGTGPFPLLDPDQESYRQFLRKHGNRLDSVKAIVLFSAHWETDQPHITACENPGIYYDYEEMRNFLPPAAFEFQYPAKGDAQLAAEIAKHLQEYGLYPVLDEQRGFDHAVYVPMTLMRPNADIPIVQMSVIRRETEAESTEMNIRLGQAMEHFRKEGYAIVGSGGSYHDFESIAKAYFEKQCIPEEATKFEGFLESVASTSNAAERKTLLSEWRTLPDSYLAHLTDKSEHLMPFMIVSGSGGEASGEKIDTYNYRGAPMSLYQW